MAPIGSEVGLYYDSDVPVVPGDYVQTRTGRSYLVTANRIQERGENKGRQHLRAIVVRKEDVEASAPVHPLQWYPRDGDYKPEGSNVKRATDLAQLRARNGASD